MEIKKSKGVNSRLCFDNIKILPKSNRSQVTIFIIIALIIVVIFLLIFLLKMKSPPGVLLMDENNPQGSIESCVREAAEDAISRISIHGGDVNPGFSVNYDGEKIVYLCHSSQFYRPCSYDRPMLVEHIEKEITDFITPKVEDCFDRLKLKVSGRYNITEGDKTIIQTSLFPKHIGITIKKDFKMEREGKTINFDNFKVNLVHPMYNFADIAMKVGNQQAKYCYFDLLGFMVIYPQYDIKETITGDSDRIYNITERSTDQKFQFAIRSCPLPPGY